MKKNYLKPSMKVINLKQRSMILCGSPFDDPNQKNDDPDEPSGAPNPLLYDGIFG